MGGIHLVGSDRLDIRRFGVAAIRSVTMNQMPMSVCEQLVMSAGRVNFESDGLEVPLVRLRRILAVTRRL